jgi:hypothetical protein
MCINPHVEPGVGPMRAAKIRREVAPLDRIPGVPQRNMGTKATPS